MFYVFFTFILLKYRIIKSYETRKLHNRFYLRLYKNNIRIYKPYYSKINISIWMFIQKKIQLLLLYSNIHNNIEPVSYILKSIKLFSKMSYCRYVYLIILKLLKILITEINRIKTRDKKINKLNREPKL